jgi:hypothetical protein
LRQRLLISDISGHVISNAPNTHHAPAAWKSIAGTDERITELDLSYQQAAQARSKLTGADRTVDLRITDAYHWLLIPDQPDPARPVTWRELKADGSRDRLAECASDKLRQSDLLRVVHDARNIRYDLDQYLAGVWQNGHIAVGQLWAYHCRHPYLHTLRDRAVLDAGIRGVADLLTWDTEAFAIATGRDDASGRYLGLVIPHQDAIGLITDSTLLVRPELALAQRDKDHPGPPGGSMGGIGSGMDGDKADKDLPPPPPPPIEPKNTRFFGITRVSPERYARDLTRLSQEIIQQLAAPDGVELEIRVEISALNSDGYSDDKVRNVTENARTLKFETYGFEDR